MNKTTFYIVQICVAIIYALSFLISIKIYRSKRKVDYMNNFYWYTTVAIFVLLIFWLSQFKILPQFYYRYVSLVTVVFHYCFLALFIMKQINDKKALQFLFYLFLIFICFLVITGFVIINSLSFLMTSLGLLIFSLYYYLELFKKIPLINLLKNPAFWVITGVFIGAGLNIPIYALGIFLKRFVTLEIYYLFANILGASYGIMHLFFIKAFTCSIPQHNQ